MQWELIVAVVIAVPVILFPAAYVWYINAGGVYMAIRKAAAKRLALKDAEKKVVDIDED